MNKKPESSNWVDPDDAPPWQEADFATAQYRIGNQPASRLDAQTEMRRRARGPGKRAAKQQLTLRIAPDVLARWKASGAGWQTRMSEWLAKGAP